MTEQSIDYLFHYSKMQFYKKNFEHERATDTFF